MATDRRLTADERRMLVHSSPEKRDAHMAGRSRREHLRLERTAVAEEQRKKQWLGKTVTRADVFDILQRYNDRNYLPLASALEGIERRRLKNRLRAIWSRIFRSRRAAS